MSDIFDVPQIKRCASPTGDSGTNDARHTLLRGDEICSFLKRNIETYTINGVNDCDRSELFGGPSSLILDSFEQTTSQSSVLSRQTDEPAETSVSGDNLTFLGHRHDTITEEDWGTFPARGHGYSERHVAHQRTVGAVESELENCGPTLLDLQVPKLKRNLLLQDLAVTDSGFAGCNSVDPPSLSSISCPIESPTYVISPRQLSEGARTGEQSDNKSPSLLKATELHQQLTRLRALFDTLQYERQDLESQLERTRVLKENLLDRTLEAKPSNDSANRSDEGARLTELRCLLATESARTSDLLAKVTSLRKRLEPDDFRSKFKRLHDEAAVRCCDYVELGRQSHEEQLAILSVITDAAAQCEISTEPPSVSLQTLLDAKEKLCELYATQIETDSKKLRERRKGLDFQSFQKLEIFRREHRPKTYQNHNYSTRLKVLKFGLEERLRHLADANGKAKILEEKLEATRTQNYVSKVETVRRLFAISKARREHIDTLRQEIRQNLQTIQNITPTVRQDSEQQRRQLAQTIARLNTQIQEVKSEVAQLKQNPVLRLQQLQSSIFAIKTAISNSEARRLATKVDIRSGVKLFKKLTGENERLKKQLAELTGLNSQLSAIYPRLDDAERLEQRTTEMLSDQIRRVDDAKAKLKTLTEIHAEEEKSQLDLVLQIEQEKEEYERRLMETKQTLARLHRQKFFTASGTRPRVHFETESELGCSDAAHSDDLETDVDPEVTFGKRCAFYCQEITRLRQRTSWLEENLREVTTQKVTPARLNAIKAMLRTSQQQQQQQQQQPNSGVIRRTKRGNSQARPLSMTAIDLPMRRLQLGKVSDNRQRGQRKLDRSVSEVTVRKFQPPVRRPAVPPSTASDRLVRSKSFQEYRRDATAAASNNTRYETGTLPHRSIFRPPATNRNTFSAFRSTKVRPRSDYDL
ncbi:hypothetical protein AAHC03_09490 [Spirometra sp. Aus1]